MSTLNRLERFLVPGLAIAIACLQLDLAATVGLSPWKGGGFGMFSSADSPANRYLRCKALLEDGQEVLVTLEGDLGSVPLKRMMTMPNRDDMARLAAELFGRGIQPLGPQRVRLLPRLASTDSGESFPSLSITSDPEIYLPAGGTSDVTESARAAAITLEVLRLHWEPETHLASFVPIRKEVFDAPGQS